MAGQLENRYGRQFYVIFKQMHVFHWWNWFTGKKYAHVVLVTELQGGGSIMIDPALGGTFIIEYKEPAYTVAHAYGDEGAEIVPYFAKGDTMVYPEYKYLRTCVSVAKDILGIKGGFIVTPKQLLRRLKKWQGQ